MRRLASQMTNQATAGRDHEPGLRNGGRKDRHARRTAKPYPKLSLSTPSGSKDHPEKKPPTPTPSRMSAMSLFTTAAARNGQQSAGQCSKCPRLLPHGRERTQRARHRSRERRRSRPARLRDTRGTPAPRRECGSRSEAWLGDCDAGLSSNNRARSRIRVRRRTGHRLGGRKVPDKPRMYVHASEASDTTRRAAQRRCRM